MFCNVLKVKMNNSDSILAAWARPIKVTTKTIDQRLLNWVKLGQFMSKMNQMHQLMDDNNDSNLESVQTRLDVELHKLFGEIGELNISVEGHFRRLQMMRRMRIRIDGLSLR